MNFKLNKWAVAFRIKTGSFLDNNNSFIPLSYDFKGFAADPFLYDYNGETYLFVEYYPFSLGRGVISYAKYDADNKKFGSFNQIIKEPYHLSYPLVFEYKGDIFMMPEAYESESLYIYKAKRFPDEWEKHAVILDDIKLVDSTPFIYDDEFYIVTKINDSVDSPMILLKISTDTWQEIDRKIVTDDVTISRPGGNVFINDNQYYMVTQDCERDYGVAVNILCFSIDSDMNLSYELTKKVTPKDISIDGVKEVNGIHTYNFNDKLEIIDYKYPNFGLYRNAWRLINKIKRIIK